MNVTVTGATGFVGRHVTEALLRRGHRVVAVCRNSDSAKRMPWYGKVEILSCDLHRDFGKVLEREAIPDVLVHLAWPGLPNYNGFFHLGTNLGADLAFLTAAIDAGVSQIVVAGTCLEYGMRCGPLAEDEDTKPVTPYGLAKDTLRKSLQFYQSGNPFVLQWMRLFYMYGEGQNEKSIFSQLEAAIAAGQPVFNMSTGDQLRDYLPIETVAENFARIVSAPHCNGVINCCSGRPVSIHDFVQGHCNRRGSSIRLNRGYYAYPDYEPLAFWGLPGKLQLLGP